MPKKMILFVPSTKEKYGTGHLFRCLNLAEELKADLYWPLATEGDLNHPRAGKTLEQGTLLESLPTNALYDLVVVDKRKTSKTSWNQLSKLGKMIIGLDEGGAYRSRFPFLLDTLDNLSPLEPNLQAPKLLSRGDQLPSKTEGGKKILVSFGGEDAKNLTGKFYNFWKKLNWTDYEVTVVIGPYFKIKGPYQGWKDLRAPGDLKNYLRNYDTVITSYGITAWESTQAGVPVLLINPTTYHQKLGLKAGFPTLSSRLRSKKAFKKAWDSRFEAHGKLRAKNYQSSSSSVRNLREFFGEFLHSKDRCPVCHSGQREILGRGPRKTYSLCKSCSMVYLTTFNIAEKQYTRSYFQEEYKNQYGKTYLEDFDHIKSMGKDRVKVLLSLGLGAGSTILDAGCAFGPFLSASKEGGFLPHGLDVSKDAVVYLNNELGYPAVEKSLLSLDWASDFPGRPALDVLTLWYVIEHFPDLAPVFKVLNQNLRLGGILAFSTPNYRGITGIFSPKKFFKESPEDHFSLWSPRIARKILPRFGFKVEKIRVTGHHPERFPFVKTPQGILFKVVAFLSRTLGWGDTFEVYARKVKEL